MVVDAPTIPVSTEENLGDPVDIKVDIINPEPVVAVAFPTAAVIRTQAQHGEAIRGILEHLPGVPIEDEMSTLRFRKGMVEAENASLRCKIMTMEAIETLTRSQEKRTRMEMDRQLASVQESQRQDRENLRKLQKLVTNWSTETKEFQTQRCRRYDQEGYTKGEVRDRVMLKVSPWKGVVRFGKWGKLNPRHVGPFQVLAKVGAIAYKLELSRELSGIYNTFHVSNLKKCYADKPLAVLLDGLHIDDKLHFVEEPIEIMDREVKRLKQSRIPIVKVQWDSRRGPEFTWERKDQFRKEYLHLFTKTAPSSSAAS
ncbi:hypothetical protein Tco_0167576 [Tanacetum coccineum]